MKIVLADSLAAEGIEALRALADSLVLDPTLTGEALVAACREADVLVVRSTRVPREVFDGAPRLALVVRAGAGVNTIDVAHAARRGVYVANCPGKNAIAVAELTLGLLLAIDRRIPENVTSFRAHQWDKHSYAKADGLAGKTFGIVGFGRIGAAVAARARAFGMHVLASARDLDRPAMDHVGIEHCRLDDLLERADVVSLHLALNDETRGVLDRARIERMKPGAILLNTARAELVDQAALLEAVERRGLRVGLDVIEDEPSAKQCELSSPLAEHPGVYVTHHIGASTAQAQSAVAAEVVRVVAAFAAGEHVPNVLNLCVRSPATHQIAVRHEDRVGVLAAVLGEISRCGLNAEEMENLIFDGAEAACCFIRLTAEPPPELLSALRELPHVLGARVQALS